MATRRDQTEGLKKKTPARKAPAKKVAARKTAEGLLRAGLKALGNVRDDVVKRQNNVIEGLLGIPKTDKSDPPRAFPGLDTFGIRKFEDVFDQRVATALQRLGTPTADEVQALRDEVRQLREQLARMSAPEAAPAPKRKR